MPFFRLLLIATSLSLSTGGLMAATSQNEGLLAREEASAPAGTTMVGTIEASPPPASEAVNSRETASVVARPSAGNKPASSHAPFRTSPYSRSYQAVRQSHDELVRSMQVRRDALHKQMQQRRDETARERTALAKQRPGPVAARSLQEQKQRNWQQQAKIVACQKKHEAEIAAFRQEMEARINDGIDAIGGPGYAYPYGSNMYPGRY